MSISATSITSLLSQIYYATGAGFANEIIGAFSFRPPQWASASAKANTLTMTAADPNTGNVTVYVFDAVIRAEHSRHSVATQHPVQTGAPITDHVFVEPARVVCEIRMSDAMQAFILGQWADYPTKSVSAFQKLKSLQLQRLPVQITTRLDSYPQMVIEDVREVEQAESRFGLRASVVFREILSASVLISSFVSQSTTVPQITGQTVVGQQQSVTVPASIVSQNFTSAASPVPGGGNWSSFRLNS